MRIGVCGIACERCPRMTRGECPNGQQGCVPRANDFCAVCTCASERGVRLCFECPDFPCATTGKGPISLGYCQYLAGKG
ncbi:MAG: DUF3795 domain-containing protein [Methanomassiliicoccales archaeon]|nr:DUF3795 domain-containing protein [Methanomassiliicoccales archaeon]